MSHRFKIGDVVQFPTRWPWGTQRVRILAVLPERHKYTAVALDYYHGWAESKDGPTTYWLGNVNARVVKETEL